jgi:hypothetical protein
VEIWHGKHKMPVSRAHVSSTRTRGGFKSSTSRAVGAVQSALGMSGCGRGIFYIATFSLQFAKTGRAATLSQQEKNNEDHELR